MHLNLLEIKINNVIFVFATSYIPAFQYVLNSPSKLFIPLEIKVTTTSPMVLYVNSNTYLIKYDNKQDLLQVNFPWEEAQECRILELVFWQVAELVRQRRGEYLLHASAVVLGDESIVLYGGSESGKTTLALELCLKYGYELYANDKLLITLQNEKITILEGDPIFNFRQSSLWKYSLDLYYQIFGITYLKDRPWDEKKRVVPKDLGIKTFKGNSCVTKFIFIKLDETLDKAIVDRMGYGSFTQPIWYANALLYWELSGTIRGAVFPAQGKRVDPYSPFCRQTSEILFIPNLDNEEIVAKRIRFLDALYSKVFLRKIRGNLTSVAKILCKDSGLC